MAGIREYFRRLRAELREFESPLLSDENRWYTEHTALLVTTVKWAALGAAAGVSVGLGTRAFLWSIAWANAQAARLTQGSFPPYFLLPLALPLCVMLIRTFAPDARGHGTEAVIAAVHQRSGRVDWMVAPVKLVATLLTLAFGGSVGKEGPAAQIGAALTSLFADIARLSDEDRRRLVICGISAGFAAVFGTPVSGALFGIEVLYLGQLDYAVIFPAMVAGIVSHLVCGTTPLFPAIAQTLGDGNGQFRVVLITLAAGALFGLVALLLIETMRVTERVARRFGSHPYLLATAGGVVLVALYLATGEQYAGLGTPTIDGVLSGTMTVAAYAFLVKIVATSVTLESGGSGGILTPVFFIGAASGAAMAPLMGAPPQLLAAFGFIAVLGAAANTPIAAAVMGIEVLPASEGVYAALAAVTAFLMVGHRSVYASQKLGFAKSAGLDVKLGGTIGELSSTALRIRKGSLTERVHKIARTIEEEIDEVTWIRPTGGASAAGDRPDRPRPSPPGARHDEPGD
jgi:H+/Cl- antiporter ClcA